MHTDTTPQSSVKITKTVILDGEDQEQKRQEVLEYFHATFSLYESLFNCLASEEAYFIKANRLRHPLIFYFAHTAVFFINKLNVAGIINQRVDQTIESNCAIGVDEMSWDDLDKSHYEWPTVGEVKRYREKVRKIVDEIIKTCTVELPVSWNSPLWIIMMGIEHERIHLETSAVLIRELPLDMVCTHPEWNKICDIFRQPVENKLLDVVGGTITLGKPDDEPVYGWDVEYGIHKEKVAPFKASKYLVSNQEFLSFVEDGGYQNRKWWTEEGWNWVSWKKAEHPQYWIKGKGKWHYRSMLSSIDMPWSWPVDINYLEAKAFCNWLGARLNKNIRMPTEAEWMAIRNLLKTDQPYWESAPGNINLEGYMSPCPVDQFEQAAGFYDIIGNVWQWTETTTDAFEGFKVHPAYDDFSVPTFDGKHNIFQGGCWISTGNYALKKARYAFRRHFLQYSGLRYVEAAPLNEKKVNVYETDQIVSQYIEFHYGENHFNVANFPETCAKLCIKHSSPNQTRRALDLGCATGRASFELTKAYERVDGIDFSARLIQCPTILKNHGQQRFLVTEEGDLNQFREINIEKFDFSPTASRAHFWQGDACNLQPKFTNYDLVLASNLIDRLYDPRKFLHLIQERINTGGLLVIASPYTWLEEFTPKEKWLGGFKDVSGERVTSFDTLCGILKERFTLLERCNIPFVIRETSRKYQHSLSDCTVWKKNG